MNSRAAQHTPCDVTARHHCNYIPPSRWAVAKGGWHQTISMLNGGRALLRDKRGHATLGLLAVGVIETSQGWSCCAP